MRTIIVILSFALSGLIFGQSLYRPCVKSGDVRYDENFQVEVNKTSYGLSFESRNPCLTKELESGIESFFRNTTYQKFKKMGKHQLHILKDRNTYYVVEEESPQKLFKLN